MVATSGIATTNMEKRRQVVHPYANSRSAGYHCAVIGCHYNQRKLNDLLCRECFDHKPLTRQECCCERPFDFYKPTSEQERREWLAKLKLKKPPLNLWVCSFHFVDKKPTCENPLPQKFLGYESAIKTRRVLSRCKPSASDSENLDSEQMLCKRPPGTPLIVDNTRMHGHAQVVEEQAFCDGGDIGEEITSAGCSCGQVKSATKSPVSDKETQWEDPRLLDHKYSVIYSTVVKSTAVQCSLDIEETKAASFLKTDSDAKLYAGLTCIIFWTLVKCMEPFAKKKVVMPVCDQIFMTLMKLRLNLVHGDLSRRFGVSESFVSRNVKFWIDTLAKHLSELIFWLPRETIRATMPDCFKRFPKTTCIMDCAETIMQKPRNLKSRGESYSNYKSHNTVKYLVTIAPSGLIMHISRAYGGRCSDKFIVQNCGVLGYLVPGDEVLADRGFTIQDILFAKQVKLNMPAFSHGKQLTEEEVTRTRRLATVRIHVERVIRRMKVFKILKDIVPITLTKQVDKILIIISALVNLDNDLIRKSPLREVSNN